MLTTPDRQSVDDAAVRKLIGSAECQSPHLGVPLDLPKARSLKVELDADKP